jgi:phosphoserine phosphatase
VRGNWHRLTRTRANKQYLRGKSAGKIEAVARQYFEPRVDNLIFPVMRSIIEAHRAAGDQGPDP